MSSGLPDRAARHRLARTTRIVVQKGSQSELTSGIPLAAAPTHHGRLAASRAAPDGPAAGLTRDGGGGQPAPRARRHGHQRPDARRDAEGVRRARRDPGDRGSPASRPGLNEIIVGERASERFGLAVGTSVTLQKRSWQVVGVFDSDGSGFESEIWGDVDVMGAGLQPPRRLPVADAAPARSRPSSRPSRRSSTATPTSRSRCAGAEVLRGPGGPRRERAARRWRSSSP